MSPGYPALSNIDRFCNYKITTEPNTDISVKFLDFDIKDSSVDASGCAFSSLRVSNCECGNSKTHIKVYIHRSTMVSIKILWVLTAAIAHHPLSLSLKQICLF